MRLLPRRRPRLPAEVADLLELGDSSVLTWSPLAVAGYAVVTRGDLRIVTASGKVIRRRWVEVDHMTWDAESGTLAVWWVGSRRPLGLELPEDSFVPEVAHERWRSSVLLTREVRLAGAGQGWVALRRDGDGTVTPQVKLPRGARRDDPAIAATLDRTVAEMRAEAGLGPDATGGTGLGLDGRG